MGDVERNGKRALDRSPEATKVKKIKKKHLLPPAIRSDPELIKRKINITDLRDLVLYILAEGIGPRWCSVRNKDLIQRVVTVMVPGLTPEQFGLKSANSFAPAEISECQVLPFFKETFSQVWPTATPSTRDGMSSPVQSFVTVPFSREEKKAYEKQFKEKSETLTVDDMVLALEDMRAHGYPIHPEVKGLEVPEELQELWLDTIKLERENKEEDCVKMFGLDCEMCDTKLGKEVARVTLVDDKGAVLIDELVKPDNGIVDYLTRYSGITKEMLDPVETKLADVQRLILDIVSSEDVLVGHSLENDLTVLKLRHPRVIDTALCYGNPRGGKWKPSLKWLAGRYMKKTIQEGVRGHDSTEDAIASLNLAQLKMSMGRSFGLVKETHTNLAKRLRKYEKSTAVVDMQLPRWHEDHARDILLGADDDDIVKGVLQCAKNNDLVFARLHELGHLAGWLNNYDNNAPPDQEKLEMGYRRLNQRLQRLYDGLPQDTALIVWTGSGEPHKLRQLRQKNKQFQENYKKMKFSEIPDPWTQKDEDALKGALKTALGGVSFLTVKTLPDPSLALDATPPATKNEATPTAMEAGNEAMPVSSTMEVTNEVTIVEESVEVTEELRVSTIE
ncbi:RNA exonuclease 1 [Trichomonascus vanleenenianus]|uniref:Rnh70p n=1 Tax=Trichomonascus vanleenenianus TaxID=2268995 RepID=UPI003EC99284